MKKILAFVVIGMILIVSLLVYIRSSESSSQITIYEHKSLRGNGHAYANKDLYTEDWWTKRVSSSKTDVMQAWLDFQASLVWQDIDLPHRPADYIIQHNDRGIVHLHLKVWLDDQVTILSGLGQTRVDLETFYTLPLSPSNANHK